MISRRIWGKIKICAENWVRHWDKILNGMHSNFVAALYWPLWPHTSDHVWSLRFIHYFRLFLPYSKIIYSKTSTMYKHVTLNQILILQQCYDILSVTVSMEWSHYLPIHKFYSRSDKSTCSHPRYGNFLCVWFRQFRLNN
jgi:hypothetical protein